MEEKRRQHGLLAERAKSLQAAEVELKETVSFGKAAIGDRSVQKEAYPCSSRCSRGWHA